MAVADVYDALRSTRPYKPAFGVDKVMGIMRSERGKHFSPLVLDAFEKIQPEFEEIRGQY